MIAMMETFKEANGVHEMMEEVVPTVAQALLRCDNQLVIEIPYHYGYSGRSKHIEILYLDIQDLVGRREIELEYCPTQ